MSYPESALKRHPFANPNRGHLGQVGQFLATGYINHPTRGRLKVVQPFDASRWLPHIGAKQRAKGKAKAGA